LVEIPQNPVLRALQEDNDYFRIADYSTVVDLAVPSRPKFHDGRFVRLEQLQAGHLRNDILLAMGLVGSTRIEVTGHLSDLGRWRAAQRLSESRLRDYVLGYFASEGFLPRPLHERHLPLREVAIVLNFAAPHRTIDALDPKRTTEHRNAWIVALQHRHQIHEAFGTRDFMVIRLTPIGAQMLLGTPMDMLTDRTLALEDVDSRFFAAPDGPCGGHIRLGSSV
jgi:hypothetical protein